MDSRATEGSRRLAKMMHLKRTKDRDEDLTLFKELNKRENERRGSLLQPVSEEFDKHGNYPLFRIPSARKGSGNELLGENEKNDYDWLKTPPATPLFPSLEMENHAPQLVIQKEIPIIIIQPPSRFAGAELEVPNLKTSSEGSKSSNLKPKPTLRPVNAVQTSQRPSSTTSTVKIGSNKSTSALQELQDTRDSNAKTKALNSAGSKKPTSVFMKREQAMFDSECNQSKPTNMVAVGTKKTAPEFEEKERVAACFSDSKTKSTNFVGTRKAPTVFQGQEDVNRESNNRARTTNVVSIKVKPSPQNGSKDMELLASNFAKTMQVNNNEPTTRRRQKSRDVSPQVRSTLPADFSNEKPENLRTERRSVSSMRGRRLGTLSSTAAAEYRKPEPLTMHQRNSCSPSVARGRKQTAETTEEGSSVQKVRASLTTAMGGNGTYVMGSKIVDKLMNARKGNTQNEIREKQSRNPRKISSSVKS